MAKSQQGKPKETDSDLLRLLVDSVIDYAIFILDVDGHVASWNRGAERIKGYKAEEIVGEHFSRFYPQEALDRRWPEHELKVATSEGRFEDEGWRLRKDGSRFWANVIITALRDQKGELRGFSKVTRDLTERKQAEEALRRSEERFRHMVEGVQDYAIFMLDQHGNVATWNAGAERIKQYKANEIIGRHFSTFYPQDVIDRGWPDHELKVAAAEGRFEDEGWRVRKDGSQFWANVVITAIRDDHGVLLGFTKVTRDLTERKQAEENARRLAEETAKRQVAYQERERLRVTLASIGDAVISTDAQGRVEFLNAVAEELVGWRSGEAVGRSLEEVFRIINENTREPVENPAMRALREGKVVGLANHTVLISKTGTERPIDDSAAPIKEANGQVIGSVLVFRDITERRRADRNLQVSEARKSAILETALDCIITMDHEGEVIEFNQACERTFGFSRERVIGQELSNFIIPPSLREKYRQGMVHYLATGEGPVLGKRLELPALRADGSEFPVELSVARICSEGAPLFTAYLRDITQQKQAEQYRNARLGATSALTDANTLEEGAKGVLQAICVNLGWDLGFVWTINDNDEALVCRQSWRKDGEETTEFEMSSRRLTFAMDEGLPGRVWASGKASWILDLSKDENFVRADTATREGLHSAVGYPLIVGERTIGVIEFFTHCPREPDPDLVEIIGTMAGGLSQFIERTTADQRRRQTEHRLQAVFNQQFQFMAILDPDGTVVDANETCFTATGYRRDQVLGKFFWETPWWSDLPRVQDEWKAQITEAAHGFGPVSGEIEYKTADGETRHATAIVTSLKDDTGQVTGLVVEGHDDTERKRAEEAMRESEEYLRSVVETTPACIKVVAADGTLVSMNSAGLRMVDAQSQDDVQGGCVYNLIPPAYRDAYREFNERVCRGESGTLEFEIEGLQGTIRHMESHAAPLRGSDGTFQQLAITYDISDRKRAERELAEAHEFLSSSLDALSSHIAVLDENGVVLAVNDAWRRFADENQFTGHNYGVGANYIESCDPNDDECLDGSMILGLKGVLAGHLPLFEFEYPCHSPTEQRWFVMRATRFKSPGPVRVVVAHEDVTKRKVAEDRLRDADRRKDEFLATLAHELRNPLAPIRNGLEILRLEGSGGEMVREARSMMERQLTHMVRLVDDLLDVSRITRNKLELRKERVALATVIHTAVETSRPLIEQSGHTFSVTLTPTPVYLDADPVRLAQVFSNLLTNAAKYTEPGGMITLTAEEIGNEAVVRVKDNGLGVPVEALPRIFEMFSQVDRNMERAQGGLGIGLTLVRRLTEMHGGTVQVASEGPRRGSEFTVRIPVLKQVQEASAAQTAGLAAGKGKRQRILVVDDNRDAASSLGMMLRLMGNEVRIAADGLAAIEVAESYRPEVILLDIGLPKLNGRDACRRIREQPWSEGMVIVALTGWGQEEDRRRSQEAGFDHHLVKPVDVDKLATLLARVKR